MAMFRFWRSELTWRERIQSVLGMGKRAITRRLHSRISIEPWRDAERGDPDVNAAPLPFPSESGVSARNNGGRKAA